MDAQLLIDWARQGIDHPLWQHIPDFDYYGIHYDEYHDTHPRLLSLYLSLFLRINGGEVSEPLLHLAMIPFPIIAVISMYYLARRFRANAFLASLLLAVSPAFLVNSHLVMSDVPGVALWLASLVLFIYGVDKDRLSLLLASGLVLTLCIFIFYQGLSVLLLFFLYAFVYRKINARTMAALTIPATLFIAFIGAYAARYGELPTFSYPFGLPLDLVSILVRLRGTTVLLGGAIIFPLAALAIYARTRFATYLAAGVGLAALIWSVFPYLDGRFGLDTLVLLPLLLATGAVILYEIVYRFGRSFIEGIRGRAKQEKLFLSTWILGTFFYCTVLLPYPSPRFMLPLVPPVAIITAKLIVRYWGERRDRLVWAAGLIVTSTLVLSLMVAVAEHKRAAVNPEIATWASERFADSEVTVWFSSGLGFQYYTAGQGYRMLIKDNDEPAPGDLIFESLGSNRWNIPDRTADRILLVEEVEFPRGWPLISEYADYQTSWTGQVGMSVPYGFQGSFLDKVFVYEVVAAASGD
jgi:hypothetical protein